MKTKLVVLSCAVASLALLSFAPKQTKVFELQANGNYKVNVENMSDKDINYLIDNTQTYDGAGVFKKTIIFTTSIKDGSVKEIDVFLSKFNQKFKYYPTMISLNVYKALEIMNDALQNGAKDANSIKKYLLNKKTFETELGVVEFDRFGDAKGSFYFINEISKEFQ